MEVAIIAIIANLVLTLTPIVCLISIAVSLRKIAKKL